MRVCTTRGLPSSCALRHLLPWMGEVILLEGLPPNNAAHKLSLVSDERRARAVADLIAESFEPGEAASTAFETEKRWPGGGRAWLMEAYFGFEPDEEMVRALIAAASDEETARSATFGLTEKRDWVANSLAGLKPVRAGRFLVHGAHDRAPRRRQRRRCRDRGGARLRHRPSRHDPRLPSAFRPAPQAPPAASGSRRRLRRGRARHRRRQGPQRKVWLGDIDPVAVEVANANARLNGVGALCRAARLARGRGARLARGRSLRSRVRQHPGEAAQADGAVARRGHRRGRRSDRLRPASCRCSGRACVLAGAGVHSGRADRPRRLVEPQIAAVKSSAEALSRFCRMGRGNSLELTCKGGESYGEGACRGWSQTAADRGAVRRDRRFVAQEAASGPLSSLLDRIHSEMPDHRRVARRDRRRGLPHHRPRGGLRPSRPQAAQGGLAGLRGDARLRADGRPAPAPSRLRSRRRSRPSTAKASASII